LRAASRSGGLVSLTGEPRAGPALAFDGRQAGIGFAACRGCGNGCIELRNLFIEISDLAGDNFDAGHDFRILDLDCRDRRRPFPRHAPRPTERKRPPH
jgi:hypothetical protein